MAARRPPGFNVDLAFADSKEVMAIPARHRNAAVGLWVRVGAWSASKLLDGYVPAEVLKAYGSTPTLEAVLVESTLCVRADNGAIQLTNWPRWQRTRAEVLAWRAGERDRKRTARGTHVDATHDPHATQTTIPRNGVRASHVGDIAALNTGYTDVSARTNPGHPEGVRQEHREPESRGQRREGRVRLLSPVGSTTGPPPPRCPKHINDPDPPPCGPCKEARIRREQSDALDTIRITDRRQREHQRRRDCWHCDDQGQITVYDDDGQELGVKQCDHPEVP